MSDSDILSTAVNRVIAFTGGGSAGHVTPNLALIELWRRQGGEAIYIGRRDSVESELLRDIVGVSFYPVPSERLRRYFHWGNFVMPFIVLWGIIIATSVLRKHKPIALFSKGGFVSLPVVIAAWINRIPVIVHESDGSLGLANRLSLPFCDLVCLGQEIAASRVKHPHVQVTGSPLRAEFFTADPQQAKKLFELRGEKPLLLIFGGSLGARKINETTWTALPDLLIRYEVVHVVGEQHDSPQMSETFLDKGYHQFRYIKSGFADLLSAAHLVICRAGANAISELVALKRPALLIPLSSESSRGDQVLNAESFCQMGGGLTISNEVLSPESLLEMIDRLESQYQAHQRALEQASSRDSAQQILDLIQERANAR